MTTSSASRLHSAPSRKSAKPLAARSESSSRVSVKSFRAAACRSLRAKGPSSRRPPAATTTLQTRNNAALHLGLVFQHGRDDVPLHHRRGWVLGERGSQA